MRANDIKKKGWGGVDGGRRGEFLNIVVKGHTL